MASLGCFLGGFCSLSTAISVMGLRAARRNPLGPEIVLWEEPKARGMDWLINHLTSTRTVGHLRHLGRHSAAMRLGLPIPEDLSLISAGYLAHLGIVNVHTVFPGVFCGCTWGRLPCPSHWGRLFGSRLLASHLAQRVFKTVASQIRVRAYFPEIWQQGHLHRAFSAPDCASRSSCRLEPCGFGHPSSSPMMRWRPWFRCPTLVYLSWVFGEHIDHVVSWVRRSEYGILVVVLLAVVWIAVKMMRKRRPEKSLNRARRVGSRRALLAGYRRGVWEPSQGSHRKCFATGNRICTPSPVVELHAVPAREAMVHSHLKEEAQVLDGVVHQALDVANREVALRDVEEVRVVIDPADRWRRTSLPRPGPSSSAPRRQRELMTGFPERDPFAGQSVGQRWRSTKNHRDRERWEKAH